MLHSVGRVTGLSSIFVLLLALAVPSIASAFTYDEGVSGDLSGDRFNPNNFALDLGSNLVTATSQTGDREYVHFSLPSGYSLASIVLEDYQSDDGLAFIGVQAGTTFTEPPTGTIVGNILGYALFGFAGIGTEVGDDLLAVMGDSDINSAQGFTPPLTGPDYTFWMQQGGLVSTYRLNFHVVPEPGTLFLAGLGCAMMLAPAVRRGLRK